MRCALAVLFLSVAFAPFARADLASARADYAGGAFEDAAREGEAAGDSESLSIASRALLAQCLLSPRAATSETIQRAQKDALQALVLDDKSVEARLDLALALGLQGERASISDAWRKRYAQRGRRLIDEALALSPDQPRALALLGGWHLEVLRRGGGAGALFLGARYASGIAAFDRARAAAPNDPAISLHYAVALLALDARKNAAQARDLLAAAGAAPSTDAVSAALREEARRLGAVLAASGAQAAVRMINQKFL